MASAQAKTVHFHEMGLDDRILKAIAKLKWPRPTLIQDKAIPLALEGKDILARAKTGSGKTGAYTIPVVQKVLEGKSSASSVSTEQRARTRGSGCVRALILVPSKELSLQTTANIKEVSSSCSDQVKVLDISNSDTVTSQRAVLVERPDIVVGTPSRVLAHLKEKVLELKLTMKILVVDEADLLFSFGYEQDLKILLSYLPSIYQAFLMSATLSEEVQSLKSLLLHNPVILKLEDSDLPEENRLTQYQIKCGVEDKFLLLYFLLKLKLVRGKTLLFVNDVDMCYKLKLYLEQFSIKSCVLNSELPHNSRWHVLNEFNRGIYDYIIASDEGTQIVVGKGSSNTTPRKRRRDKEYSVARGIDFQGVDNVINFDCPPKVDSYIHRVGRTARGCDCGTALTFVTPEEEDMLSQLEERLKEVGSDTPIKPYRFRMAEIEGFRYRVKDAIRAVTKASIKEARLKEIRLEMLNSKRLQTHFEENPRDLQVLRHDRVLQPTRVQPHLKFVPSYLMLVKNHSNTLYLHNDAMKKYAKNVPKALLAAETDATVTGASFSKRRRLGGGKKMPSMFAARKGRTTSQRRKDPLRTYGK